MNDDRPRSENERLRVRLARLTEAILRISENLDLETVLQEIVDSARSLTGARYSAITTIDDDGELQDVLISGLDDAQMEGLMTLPKGWDLFRYLGQLPSPLRINDFVGHLRSAGFPVFHPAISAFLGAQIQDRDRRVGNIYIGEKEGGPAFTRDDEETLDMFASQAAMAIINARRYGAEQRANADLEALIDTSPVGVLVVDAKSRNVVQFNEEARRLAGGIHREGHDFDRLLQLMTFRRMDGREIPRADLPMERAIESGETIRAEEIVIQAADGPSVTTLVNTTPIYGDDGEILSAVATIQDITPLEELERLRAEFLGMVSHELRTPLTSIKGSAATALGAGFALDPAETNQFFRIIEEQADLMRDLINDLLDLTRIEAGTLSVVPESTDVADVIDQARNAFLSSGYRNSVDVDLVPDLPRIGADRQRIGQVLYNLFSNASKYSREWSTIRVSTSHDDWHVSVTVADEGQGIASEHLPYVFSKFSRISRTDSDAIGGYGLGLAICKGIVQAHGGRIWAESDGHGHGTRVTFTVPVLDESRKLSRVAPDPLPASRNGGPSSGERILVIDDDPQILRHVRSTLSEAGYAPIVTSDPDDLDRLLREHDPQLVLLNLVLPGAIGFDLVKRIPNVFEVPVIFLSGRGREQDFATAFDMGATDYVVKPFSQTELVARVRAALQKRSLYVQAKVLEPFQVGELTLNYMERRVILADRAVRLTPTQYRLLEKLATNAGRVVRHDELLDHVWGRGHSADQRLLRSFVKGLRRKLGDNARSPDYIFTESGVGYRMAKP